MTLQYVLINSAKFIKYTCWVRQGVTKKWKNNSEKYQHICVKLRSCSRCSYDAIPGCSPGGLSPIRLDQATPRPTPAHGSSVTTLHEPPVELWTPSVADPLDCQETCEGWRTWMEVHLKASSKIFDTHRIDFPLSLPHVSGQQTLSSFESALWNLIRSALSM